VEDVRAAGIDVYTTLNVQHLESLNDIVARVSGVRVRETLPDAACYFMHPVKGRAVTRTAYRLGSMVPRWDSEPITIDAASAPDTKKIATSTMTTAVTAREARSGLKLGIWQGVPFDGADSTVTASWSAAVARLGKAGVRLSDETVPLVDDMVRHPSGHDLRRTLALAAAREDVEDEVTVGDRAAAEPVPHHRERHQGAQHGGS
jgi:Asp-tRNA(Asn)/Glu-tRNA(Gln) amidotransferase A subunit family amidase